MSRASWQAVSKTIKARQWNVRAQLIGVIGLDYKVEILREWVTASAATVTRTTTTATLTTTQTGGWIAPSSTSREEEMDADLDLHF